MITAECALLDSARRRSRLLQRESENLQEKQRNFAIQEITHRGNEQYWKDLFYGGALRYEKGFALPPDRPGLGVDLNEKVAAKRPYQPHTRQQLRFPDGGIADH